MNTPKLALKGYQIEEKLSEGGMGAVYKAIQLSVDRAVAIKVLRNTKSSKKAILNFRKEAQILAQINHPNVVQVLDLISTGGVTHIVMELVTGSDLGERFKRMGRLSESVALNFMEQSASGLQAAHKNLISHRDVKPSNLMLTLNGVIKVTDFGLAESGTVDLLALPAGSTGGTPNYISPEQALGEDVDIRADIFSLGATFFHLIAGEPPFNGNSVRELVMSRVVDDALPLKSVVPEISEALSDFIGKMLDGDVNKRPQNMQMVIDKVRDLRLNLSTDIEENEVEEKPELKVHAHLERQQIRELNLIELSARSKIISRSVLNKALEKQRDFTKEKRNIALEKVLLDNNLVQPEAFIALRKKLDEQLQLNENKRLMLSLDNILDNKSKTFKELLRMSEKSDLVLFNYFEKIKLMPGDKLKQLRDKVLEKEMKDYERSCIKLCLQNKLLKEEQVYNIESSQGQQGLLEHLVEETYLKDEEVYALLDVQKMQSMEYFYSMEMLSPEISFRDHIACPHCKAQMFADDERCKSCGKNKNQKRSDKTRQYRTSELEVVDTSKIHSMDKPEWYIKSANGEMGPFPFKQIIAGVKSKKLLINSLLKRGAKGKWLIAEKTPFLARAFGVCYKCGSLRPKKKSPCPSCQTVD